MVHKRWRKALSFLVSVSMAIGLVPTPALAEALEDLTTDDNLELVTQTVPDVDATPIVQEEEPANNDADPLEQEDLDDVSVSIQGDEQSPDAVQLNTDYSISTNVDESWYGTFTAPEDGAYEFSLRAGTEYTSVMVLSEDEQYGYRWYGLDYSYAYTSEGATLVRYMTAGTTLYIRINGDWGSLPMDGVLRVAATDCDYRELGLAHFEISPSQLELPNDVTFESVSVTDIAGNSVDEECFELVYYTRDYESVYDEETNGWRDEEVWTPIEKPTSIGEYYVAARAKQGNAGGYTGETAKQSYTINDPYDLGSPSYWYWCFEDGNWYCETEFTGEAINIPATKVHRTVWNDETSEEEEVVLSEGTDYTVRIGDGDSTQICLPGDYTLYCDGIGAYKGTLVSTLCVRVTYSGYDIAPCPEVEYEAVDPASLELSGTATLLDDGAIQLTDYSGFGTAWADQLYDTTNGLNASFSYCAGLGDGDFVADGMMLMFSPSKLCEGGGSDLGLREGAYGIEMDSYPHEYDEDEAIGDKHIAITKDSHETHLAYAVDSRAADAKW
ncbi:MAG: hypothetical protein Q4A07_13385, partial [Coriobacteriales bacterium]|nr:hypothetical protein [Coriobacteriales bacterium]